MYLRICADLYSNKINLEVNVSNKIDLIGLRELIVGLMEQEGDLMRAPNQPRSPFSINRLQVFNEQVGKWVDLVSMGQLRDGSQLYAFQPQTNQHSDVQQDLPPPRPPSTVGSIRHMPQPIPTMPTQHVSQHGARSVIRNQTSVSGSASGSRVYLQPAHQHQQQLPQNSSADVSETEKLKYIFEEMDQEATGRVSITLFVTWVRKFIDFNDETLELLFNSVDPHRKGWLAPSDFEGLSKRFPNVMDIIFHRAADSWDVMNREAEIQQAQQTIQNNTLQEEEIHRSIQALQAQLASMQAENEALHQQTQTNVTLNAEVTTRQGTMHNEERALMEREINMERHREALRDSEVLFLEQSQQYNLAASALGSPRRAKQY
eukprot:TRINITY_DN4458_c0_g1_i1.p1 TRINITY_DN4458_c0_g1~~TRINITY_DN4458_c0_g1_i1.p1  ORF type:complete len:375 (+),score=41.34 TRINITY_DN4458_c0_g1_i1:88-1212(+)